MEIYCIAGGTLELRTQFTHRGLGAVATQDLNFSRLCNRNKDQQRGCECE
jgi:hypothetical protein